MSWATSRVLHRAAVLRRVVRGSVTLACRFVKKPNSGLQLPDGLQQYFVRVKHVQHELGTEHDSVGEGAEYGVHHAQDCHLLAELIHDGPHLRSLRTEDLFQPLLKLCLLDAGEPYAGRDQRLVAVVVDLVRRSDLCLEPFECAPPLVVHAAECFGCVGSDPFQAVGEPCDLINRRPFLGSDADDLQGVFVSDWSTGAGLGDLGALPDFQLLDWVGRLMSIDWLVVNAAQQEQIVWAVDAPAIGRVVSRTVRGFRPDVRDLGDHRLVSPIGEDQRRFASWKGAVLSLSGGCPGFRGS